MEEIDKDTEGVWSFLLFSGYLKLVKREFLNKRLYCNLRIPNLEVEYLYEKIILSWFSDNINNDKFQIMLRSLVNGDIKTFDKIFKEFVLKSVSYFDAGGNEPEKVYHAFVLGMLIALNNEYEVKSNKESGYGRYDVMIIPKDTTKKGIIIEFKKVDEYDNEDLEMAVSEALKQIEEKNYKQELLDRGIKDILQIGMAFEGRKVMCRAG
ncbi:MAG: PD-(D/E)XK nuclease domain-containing protein [Bacillota bacterium]|nr:PD-(D/E)XK nuclease domain-containing protein [Bacillota bacterium]